jgi:Retroviral aspartyl protease
VNVLNRRRLNEVFNFVYKFKLSFERQQKRSRGVNKQQPVLKYINERGRFIKGKQIKSPTSTDLVPCKERRHSGKGRTITFKQSIALRLCHKCNEKYYSGHKCTVNTPNTLEGQNEEEENLKSESEKEVEEGVQEIEEATVSMFNTKNNGIAKVMKFKGEVQKLSICALLDSDSTHSFVNPSVLRGSKQNIMKTLPMIVIVTNDAKMVTNQQCKALNFSIQDNIFEKVMRLLDVQGYEIILMLD